MVPTFPELFANQPNFRSLFSCPHPRVGQVQLRQNQFSICFIRYHGIFSKRSLRKLQIFLSYQLHLDGKTIVDLSLFKDHHRFAIDPYLLSEVCQNFSKYPCQQNGSRRRLQEAAIDFRFKCAYRMRPSISPSYLNNELIMHNLRLERHRIVSLSYNYAPDCIPNKQWGEYCVRISTASHVPELHSHLSSFDIDYFQDEIHH